MTLDDFWTPRPPRSNPLLDDDICPFHSLPVMVSHHVPAQMVSYHRIRPCAPMPIWRLLAPLVSILIRFHGAPLRLFADDGPVYEPVVFLLSNRAGSSRLVGMDLAWAETRIVANSSLWRGIMDAAVS